MRLRLAVFILVLASAARAAEIKGKVTNAVGGEALGRVEVVVLEAKLENKLENKPEKKTSAVTSSTGEFDIPSLAPGSYTLRLNAVGYRLLTIPFTLAAATDVKEFSITMVPDNFHHTDKVEVRGDVFQGGDSPATVESNLTSSEIRETSTVFADDPFRAVQTLPGVSAEGNNEFFAEFSVMGAPFSSVSIYIDDVLVPSPFHEIGNSAEGASLGVLTSEVVEEMKLLPAAYPEKFGDATGAALDIHTREGSRGAPLFRLTAGIAASELLGEGGLGGERKGSWLVSARKSYINYLVQDRIQNAADVGFYDGDLKLNYDLAPRQNLNFFATGGHTDMHDPTVTAADTNSFASGQSDFTLVRAGWRWSVSPQLLMDARAAYLREPDQLFNPANQVVATTYHGEWVGGSGLTWAWSKEQVLEAGWTERQLRDDSFQAYYPTTGAPQFYAQAESGLRQSGYLQQSSSLLGGRVHVLGGVRWDSLQLIGVHPFSPQIAMAVRATSSTELQFGVARYQQFTQPFESGSVCPGFGFMPEKSDHYTAAVEQRLGENTRVRLQAFDRQDAQSMGLGSVQPVITSPCPSLEPIPNSTIERDYSRGVQLILQRRSANRLSGWLGYTWARAESRQYMVQYQEGPQAFTTLFPYNSPYAPTLDDQRNSLNAFATYRLKPTINLSGKFLFGSGFPVASGVFVLVGGNYQQVGTQTLRFPYQRLDLRVDKDWAFKRWKLTLYGEVLNLTNHYNARDVFSSGVDPNTGQAQLKMLQGLPITPTAGLAFQF
ncbi:MAG: carboxypeptidase regulatory-like domain-containing protein [Candidatus Sulfotelmatobacter sp.]